MKIIIENIQCTTGTCQHTAHNINMIWWLLLGTTIVYVTYITTKRVLDNVK